MTNKTFRFGPSTAGRTQGRRECGPIRDKHGPIDRDLDALEGLDNASQADWPGVEAAIDIAGVLTKFASACATPSLTSSSPLSARYRSRQAE